MEYPSASVSSVPPNYQQSHEQPQPAGSNVQNSGHPFSSAEPSTHNRAYTSYQQSYQSSSEGHPNSSNNFSGFSPDGSGQSITLNQLLQQGGSPAGFQTRPQFAPSGTTAYRSYEQFYGYKSGLPAAQMERPNANNLPYGTHANPRFSDPYMRSIYSGYPAGSTYAYYQTGAPPGTMHHQQMQQVLRPQTTVPQMDYSSSNPISPYPPQSTTPANGGDGPLGCPSSTMYPNANQINSQTPSPGPHRAITPFASLQQIAQDPRSSSRDTDSHDRAHATPSSDSTLKSFTNPAGESDNTSPSALVRPIEGSKSPVACETPRELPDEQQSGRQSVETKSANSVLRDACSPSANLNSSSTLASPAMLARGTPPSDSPTVHPSFGNASPAPQQGIPNSSSSGGSSSPRPPCIANPQHRPFNSGVSGQVPRHPYPCAQPGQPYAFGNRTPLYGSTMTGYTMRPMVNNFPTRHPSQYPFQPGAASMPPPAPPPQSNQFQSGPGPAQQNTGPPYSVPSSVPYCNASATWDPHSGSPLTGGSPQHHQQLYDRGAPSADAQYPGSPSMGMPRMPNASNKINPSGMAMKHHRVESGMRPPTPNHLSGLADNPPSGLTGPSMLSDECIPVHNQPHPPMLQHPPQAALHPYPGWPEGVLSGQSNPYNIPFPHQQHQQQHPSYYRSHGPSMHMAPQYPHGMMHPNVMGGPSMYVSPGMPPHGGMGYGISNQSSSGFQKLLEMGNEPERRQWLEHYIRFMEDIGKPLVGLPQVVKQPLDLYRFYLAVRERGGVLEVIKARRWKEISQLVNINASASAAYTLRKNYCKFLLDYECRFDRGGVDPRSILMHIESMSGKKKKLSPGDVDSGSNSGLQLPAPPSPTGSHSSASSSIHPPGSGSTSLQGIPTTGTGASDGQIGQAQSRNNDLSGATQSDVLNGLPSSPSQLSGTPFSPSPRRPNSTTSAINGYNTSLQSEGTCPKPWPWSSEPSTSQPSSSINGCPSLLKGQLSSQPVHSSFDVAGAQSNRTQSPLIAKAVNHQFVPGPPNSSVSSSSLPHSSATTSSATYGNKDPTVHHFPESEITAQHASQTPATAKLPPSPLHPRICSPAMNARPPHLMNGSSGGTGDSIAFLCMQQYRHPANVAAAASGYPQGPLTGNNAPGNAPGVPAHLIHHHGQRPGYVATIFKRVEHHPFPAGSVEATQINSTKRRRYRARDVGPISPSKLLMALRSGLTAEVSWALNCLNILLRDESGAEFLGAINLSTLVTNLIDLWRHSLGDVFSRELFIDSLELPADLNVQANQTADTRSLLSRGNALSTCSTSLSDLERKLTLYAESRNIPIHALRERIHQLLRKKENNVVWYPTRLRNGLSLTRTELVNLPTGSNLSVTPSPDSFPGAPIPRSRKRGKSFTPNQVYNPPTSTGGASYNVLSNLVSLTSIPAKRETGGFVRVVTTSAHSNMPQAWHNLCQLALFALEQLEQSDEKATELPGSKSDHAKMLQRLMTVGGGDTTCHIMPPFGAAVRPTHEYDVPDSSPFAATPRTTSTPPPVVVKEKCVSADDEDDSHLYAKRGRHASSSSLGCPVLSPQPLEDDQDVCKQKPLVVHESDPDCSHSTVDTDSRCPLRAREELVYHGLACLWPDHHETDANEARAVRCLCVSTVLRNLSFVSLLETHLSTHRSLLALLGRVLLLGHDHVGPSDTWESVELKAKRLEASLCAWRTPSWLEDMRENAMVLLVNIAGYLNLIHFEESIVRPILEGLIHWIICPTAASSDPFPGHRTLSPRRLALEAVNRLAVHQANVDLLLSTPAACSSDLSKLFDRLANWLAIPEDQVTRELALSTMHYLTGGGMSTVTVSHIRSKLSTPESTTPCSSTHYIGTTMLAFAKPCPISGLLAFIESAEATTRRVIEQFGIQALQERPELMGTSLEMVRRAGALIDRLAADPNARTFFTPSLELRLMDLVTSRVLDATVAHLLCGALHRLSSVEKTAPVTDIITPLIPTCPSVARIKDILTEAEMNRVKHDVHVPTVASEASDRELENLNTQESPDAESNVANQSPLRNHKVDQDTVRSGSPVNNAIASSSNAINAAATPIQDVC